MGYEHLQYGVEDASAVVTLNRPERRNALSAGLMLELVGVLEKISIDASVRTVILAANGSAFSAGHDLSEMVGRKECDYDRLFEICTNLMLTIHSIPQPVIAEVQGVATAAGCQLVAACDLAIASQEAMFATPGVRIGLFCTTPMVPLTRAIGRKRAMQMLLTGDAITAATAEKWGLINRAVAAAELKQATRDLSRKIAQASSLTVGIGKRAFYEQIELEERSAYEHARQVMTANALAGDAQEGMSAFLQKRAPAWTGK